MSLREGHSGLAILSPACNFLGNLAQVFSATASIFVFDRGSAQSRGGWRLKVRLLNDWNYWNICREMTGERSPNGVNGMAR